MGCACLLITNTRFIDKAVLQHVLQGFFCPSFHIVSCTSSVACKASCLRHARRILVHMWHGMKHMILLVANTKPCNILRLLCRGFAFTKDFILSAILEALATASSYSVCDMLDHHRNCSAGVLLLSMASSYQPSLSFWPPKRATKPNWFKCDVKSSGEDFQQRCNRRFWSSLS